MFYSGSRNRHKRWWSVLSIGQKKLLWLGVLLITLVLVLLGVLLTYSFRAAAYDLNAVAATYTDAAIYDYDDKVILSLSETHSKPVQWEDLPATLVNAFVAREDEDFFEHGGIVYSAVIRSVLKNLTSMRYEQGASTITMQLARNVFEMQDKTMDRKLVEVFLARRIEAQYDKQTILVQYLNRIYFGCNCYGIGAAAEYYFGKNVAELNLVECATLAGLVRGPSIFNPVADMEKAMGVKKETLQRMAELEFISETEMEQAIAAPIILNIQPHRKEATLSYVSQWVGGELKSVLDKTDLQSAGIAVLTTVDLEIQQFVESAAETALSVVEGAPVPYPADWLEECKDVNGVFDPARKEADQKFFFKKARPAGLPVRGDSNETAGLLQCCVLVVDGRPGHAGELLAMTCGRAVSEGRNRWAEKMKPGRNSAPILFCAADADHEYLLSNDVVTTGEKTGYDKVSAFYRTLGVDMEMPTADKAGDLYTGHFAMNRLDLAKVLFAIQNRGHLYDFYSVRQVLSQARKSLFEHARLNVKEYIPRECAERVYGKSPFVVKPKAPVILAEPVPDNGGYWVSVSNANGVSVFLWMGFDAPIDKVTNSSDLNALIARASIYLARQIHRHARARLVSRSARK